jgi:2-polyprenyl-3-methyl-5-hydroxy-6-metoxy-1,4-benzoquinol methylase
LLSKLKSIFFYLDPARKALSRIRGNHYRARAALVPHWPPPLGDLSNEEVDQINKKSDEYFSNESQQTYWKNKPLSDLDNGPACLWRFGLLLSALGIRPEDRVLDFGCGTGWTSFLLARTGAEITAMDISSQALSLARSYAAEEPSRLRFQQFDGTKIDAPDGYFDFVLTLDAFHHFPNPVVILKEFHRVLNQHGCFAFAEPGIGHSETDTAQHESEHGVLENEIDPEQLRITARNVGFDELELIVPPIPPNIMTLPMPRARWYLRGLPWIVPHDYIRASILSSPIGILRKGPYTSTSLHPHKLIAQIQPLSKTINAASGKKFVVKVSVQNKTGTVWLKTGRRGAGFVRLGAQLFNDHGQMLIPDYGRVEIPRDMKQNDEAVLELELSAPANRGQYNIRLDMVDEGVTWFSEKTSHAVEIPLIVT